MAFFPLLSKDLLRREMLYIQIKLVHQTQLQGQHWSFGKRGTKVLFLEVCSVPSILWIVLLIFTVVLPMGVLTTFCIWKTKTLGSSVETYPGEWVMEERDILGFPRGTYIWSRERYIHYYSRNVIFCKLKKNNINRNKQTKTGPNLPILES